MTLYLDSASLEDARRVAELGFVVGITTNPGSLGFRVANACSTPHLGA